MYPEYLTFSENNFRTTRVHEVFPLLFTVNRDFAPENKRTRPEKPALSYVVGTVGTGPPIREGGGEEEGTDHNA